MASIAKKRIENVFKASLENIRNGKNPAISREMKKAGYSPSASKALQVTRTKTWQTLLTKIDDEELLNRLTEIALDRTDKRAALQGITELLKLKDRYPDRKVRFGAIEEQKDVFD